LQCHPLSLGYKQKLPHTPGRNLSHGIDQLLFCILVGQEQMVSSSEIPQNISNLDLSKVYYFAFADDLALFSANLSRVERVLKKLNASLPEYGMSVNVAKTEWMPFFPVGSRYQVETPRHFSLR
jgi:hypothetical protein